MKSINPRRIIYFLMNIDLCSSVSKYKNEPNATPRNMNPLVGKRGKRDPRSALRKLAINSGRKSNQ